MKLEFSIDITTMLLYAEIGRVQQNRLEGVLEKGES